MINIFNNINNIFKKKYDYKGEKIKLIDKIKCLEKTLLPCNLNRVIEMLDDIVYIIDDASLNLTQEQIENIRKHLNDIGTHMNKNFENYLTFKCNSIKKEINYDTSIDNSTLPINDNEGRLLEMLGELSCISKEIETINGKMDLALGKDKNLWNMLNSQKHILQNKMLVLNKNYGILINSIGNVSLANDVKKASIEAGEILNQCDNIDINEFNENAESTTRIENDVNDISNKMNETFSNNFQNDPSDYEYEKALEEKLLNDKDNNVQTNNGIKEDK